ncbi:MAG: aminotransferase class III-fold pyridoxal phosphate-dependent enzyme [Gammaproteobacteria bacterium]|nr:aminotransferase class III-fold pyridoxal phosphate-dependent enzyme [Gammaproteobacteria bacterium]
MSANIPGKMTRAMLERGIPLFRNGLRYAEESQKAQRRGYRGSQQIVIDRAEGPYIWDLDGNRFVDFQNGWATNPVGNAHPEVVEAVNEAHKRYGFHYDHPLRYELAEKLAEIMPGGALPRFSFEVSGTEAAEAAVQLALCYTQRRYIIAFSSSFHGEGLSTKLLSGYDGEKNRYLEAWTGGVIRAPYPYSDNIPASMTQEQYVDYCLWYLDNHIPDAMVPRDNIAAILIEPGLAEGGNWIPPHNFLKGIREICDKNNWLMIADEVLTGLGRTGKMWAVEHYDVVPDILVVGKNLSGGIAPCAGIAARDEILGDNPHFSSGSTFAGTPAGCAAGLKTLELYERYDLVGNAARLGKIASTVMQGWEQYDVVRQVRSNGLLMGVSFQSPEENEKDEWFARAIRSRMLENGVWAISDEEVNVRMYPALNMEEAVLREGLEKMEEAIVFVDRHGQDVGNSPLWPTGV